MAAYASLLSLMTTLNNIQIHPRVSTFFYRKQIQSLHQIINFLLHFIESSNFHGGSKDEEEALEMRIASTTHAAEDVIESHLVHQILADAPQNMKFEASNMLGRFRRQVINCARPTTYSADCLLDLETEIKDMNSVKETVMEFQGKIKFEDEQSSPVSSSRPLNTAKKDFVVGFDEKVIQIMDRLTAHQPDLQIVPIVGMGGIGKTTLARNIYHNSLIVESFDIRAWVTISQKYSVKDALSELLSCIGPDCDPGLETEDHELGLKLYKTLWGRRYLIVLDDIWSLEVWDKIRFYFPNNDDRSRVVITTRISSVATHLSSSSFEMNFLDEDQSWELFCGNVFLNKCCPPELEKIGKKIVRECKGLPLSIVVIGGLLRNSTSTHLYWKNFARDLNSILMYGNDECLKILSLSYNHLPAHLKPCFLYMGIFQEDVRISVSLLIRLFVSEGFLKPKEGQNMEDVAEDYINDLVDRNLIIVDSWRWNGSIKYCKMHDRVREVCLKIGERQKIFHGMRKLHIPVGFNKERRIVLDGKVPRKWNWPKVFEALPSASLARTLVSDWGQLRFKFRLLRVLSRIKFESPEDICQHVNLRFLLWRLKQKSRYSKLPSSVSLLWNVHTLIFEGYDEVIEAPPEIWYMRQLKHLQFPNIFLPLPPSENVEQEDDDVLLPNLHTLSKLVNFSFTERVCKRIPNIKKLGISYTDSMDGEKYKKKGYYCLNHLHKLQSLYCSFGFRERDDLLQGLLLPSSLRKLSLAHCHLRWEELNIFGLSLPHLEVLKLVWDAAAGDEWDCAEGAFPSLKFLRIECINLRKWTAESSEFFPVLEELHLGFLFRLERIPSFIGEIQTLGRLCVHRCSLSVVISSTEILEEQLGLGNDDLQLELYLRNDEEMSVLEKQMEIKSFTAKNIKHGRFLD